ncbi:phosphoenolpyruvate-utilizing N-terminal domain-containing protein [Streptosporangium sp. NPDC002544]|uniref:phosphoenolpyruvate-utilizing N-terminal domain-containing protein n=1 Tax=Streptosporangium sp. NPDC002544 TaxID=3154538 RepID=UPI0033348BFA
MEEAVKEPAVRAAKATDPAARDVLEAQAVIVADPVPRESVEQHVGAAMDAAHAINIACAHHRRALLSAGGYFAERASDLDDIGNRAVAVVLGLPMPGVPSPGHPLILTAGDLASADIVSARGVPAGRNALARHSTARCRHNAQLARAACGPDKARRTVRESC